MVLMPCGRCCDTCTCSCTCCECANFGDDGPGAGPVSAYETFLTIDGGLFFAPYGYPGMGDRVFDAAKFPGIQAYLEDCGITRRWSSQGACVAALIAAEKAAILAAGGPPYEYDLFDAANGYPATPTATSSLTLDERLKLWAFTTVTTGPSLAHDLLNAAATLADEAAVDAFLADLFDAGSWGNLDPTVPLWGYCSSTVDTVPGGDWWLGWSIPYRNGQPFTLAALKALCPAGVPFQGGAPPLAWFWPVFADDTEPRIRSVVLASSTGDAIADRLIEIGTRPKSDLFDELGNLPDWTKLVTTERETCETRSGVAGTKTVTIQIDYVAGAVHQRWTLIVTFSACINREDDEPENGGVSLPHVTAYEFWFDDDPPNNPDDPPNNPVSYQTTIASTASIRPYASESDCNGIRDDSPCSGGLWQVFTREETGDHACCGRSAAE